MLTVMSRDVRWHCFQSHSIRHQRMDCILCALKGVLDHVVILFCFAFVFILHVFFTFKMKTKVKFFCKLRISSDKDKSKRKSRVVIYSICRTATSFKYVFATEDQELDKHLPGVKAAVIAAGVRSKKHVDYTLKDDEVNFYINPATSKYWFNGKELKKLEASQVSNNPSEDREEEPTPSPSKSNCTRTLSRQSAVDNGKIIFWLSYSKFDKTKF